MAVNILRDDRLRVFTRDRYSRALTDHIADIDLSKIPDNAFDSVAEIIKLISTPAANLSAEDLQRKYQIS